MKPFAGLLFCSIGLFATAPSLAEIAVPDSVLELQQQRIEVLRQVSAATVAVFDNEGGGGGSAVLISADGFALTNFHVTAACGVAMKCGLPDGRLYDAVIVGIDPVGDVALIQLLDRDDFPYAELGDSDAVQVGDWVYVVGNPFLLANDFFPSVSFGMVSGVHRYQYPAGTLLEYADCIQTDAAINPGNSGGPLFDDVGRLIGINGRGSFEKRGRVNVGVGYAISINQIKRFLSHLKSGRIVDHATLGATVTSNQQGEVIVDDILESSDAFRRGLRYDDEILQFAGREISTVNAMKNGLGVYPSGWTVPLRFRSNGTLRNTRVRLMGLHDPAELFALVQQENEKPTEPPEGKIPQREEDKSDKKPPLQKLADLMHKQPKLPAAVAERYEARHGYANYWFNEKKQHAIWQRWEAQAAMEPTGYGWQISGSLENGDAFQIELAEDLGRMRLPWGESGALFRGELSDQLSPPGSGGLLLALHLWQRLQETGLRKFGEVYYLGQLPFGPEGDLADCLVGIYAGLEARFFFATETGDLQGIELFAGDGVDPCELALSDYQEIEGHRRPMAWLVRHGNAPFARLRVEEWHVR